MRYPGVNVLYSVFFNVCPLKGPKFHCKKKGEFLGFQVYDVYNILAILCDLFGMVK